jgi:hypothetical protein
MLDRRRMQRAMRMRMRMREAAYYVVTNIQWTCAMQSVVWRVRERFWSDYRAASDSHAADSTANSSRPMPHTADVEERGCTSTRYELCE